MSQIIYAAPSGGFLACNSLSDGVSFGRDPATSGRPRPYSRPDADDMPPQLNLACSEMPELENDERKQVLFAKIALPKAYVANFRWGA